MSNEYIHISAEFDENHSTDFILKKLMGLSTVEEDKNKSITPIKNVSGKTYDINKTEKSFSEEDEVSRDTGLDTMSSRKRSRSSAFSSNFGSPLKDKNFDNNKSRSPNTPNEMRAVSGHTGKFSIINESDKEEGDTSATLGLLKPSYSSPHITSSPSTRAVRKYLSTLSSFSPRQQSLPASFHSSNSSNESPNFPVLRKCLNEIPLDEPFPIKSNSSSLSWGSIKLRKTVEKSLQIKNTAKKRVVIKIQISGPGFQVS